MDFDLNLTNPEKLPDPKVEIEAPIEELKPDNIKQLELEIPIQEGRVGNLLDRMRYKISRREAELELMPFWRNLASPFAIVTSIATILIHLSVGIAFFERIPPKIPFYYNSIDGRWEQADKILVILLPVILGMVQIILLRIIYSIFSFDKRSSVTLSWVLSIFNILFLVAMGQIYILIL